MIRVNYHLTPSEQAFVHAANQMTYGGIWKISGIFAMCFTPGVIIAYLLGDFVSLITAVLVLIFLISTSLLRAFGKQGVINKEDRQVTFTSDSRQEDFKNSKFQLRLSEYDSWRETKDFFVFNRFGIITVEPKRVFSEDQIATLRSYLNAVQPAESAGSQSAIHPTDASLVRPVEGEPVPLYQAMYEKLKAAPNSGMTWTFRNRRSDFDDYHRGGYRPATLDNFPLPEKKTNLGKYISTSVFFAIISGVILLWLTSYPAQTLTLAGCVGAPFALAFLIFRHIQRRDRDALKRITDDVFERDIELGLTPEGWFMASPTSISFHHWLDVDGFRVNTSSVLITSFQTNHLIPKRIFGDSTQAAVAILTMLRMHDQAISNRHWDHDGEAVTAIESGNPFQAPQA